MLSSRAARLQSWSGKTRMRMAKAARNKIIPVTANRTAFGSALNAVSIMLSLSRVLLSPGLFRCRRRQFRPDRIVVRTLPILSHPARFDTEWPAHKNPIESHGDGVATLDPVP